MCPQVSVGGFIEKGCVGGTDFLLECIQCPEFVVKGLFACAAVSGLVYSMSLFVAELPQNEPLVEH